MLISHYICTSIIGFACGRVNLQTLNVVCILEYSFMLFFLKLVQKFDYNFVTVNITNVMGWSRGYYLFIMHEVMTQWSHELSQDSIKIYFPK